jgi:hypothetical protein
MSREIVVGRDGRLYVIDGVPGAYDVHAVDEESIARYTHKFEARRDLMHGRLEAPS